MYVYIKSEPGLWTVGFYRPDGTWDAESDHLSASAAAVRVHFLNGGGALERELLDALKAVMSTTPQNDAAALRLAERAIAKAEGRACSEGERTTAATGGQRREEP